VKKAKTATKKITAAEVARAHKQLDAARAVISAAEDSERAAINKSHVGRFYRYRNCYSCPETDADYWWLYIAVTGVDEYGNLQGWSVQTDKDGKLTLETGRISPVSLREEIGMGAFCLAFAEVEKRVQEFGMSITSSGGNVAR
jgi:hypothetical protein